MPEHSDDPKPRRDERTRRRNKWIMAAVLAATAIALYLGIMVRLAVG